MPKVPLLAQLSAALGKIQMKNEDLPKLFLLLIVVYFLRTGYHFSMIFELTTFGVINVLIFLAYVIGNICLLVGAIRYLFMKKGKGKLFLISVITLGISLPTFLEMPNHWGLLGVLFMSPAILPILGVLFGIMGWWLSYNKKVPNPSFKGTPNGAPLNLNVSCPQYLVTL